MILTQSETVSRGVTTEEQWKELEKHFLNGETIKSLSKRYGIRAGTIQYQATRREWRERLAAARVGRDYHSGPVSGAVIVDKVEEEIEEAKGLRGKHQKAYYRDLDKIRAQLDHIDGLIMGCVDSMQLAQLCKAFDTLEERYRIIQGISGPAVLKGEKERKVKSAPILPLDG